TYSGGVVGAIKARFWGRPVPTSEQRTQLHIPIASDMAQLSADLVFGEEVTFELPKTDDDESSNAIPEAAHARLAELMGDDHVHAELLKAGEFAAALGGSYLAAVWDTSVSDKVWVRAY